MYYNNSSIKMDLQIFVDDNMVTYAKLQINSTYKETHVNCSQVNSQPIEKNQGVHQDKIIDICFIVAEERNLPRLHIWIVDHHQIKSLITQMQGYKLFLTKMFKMNYTSLNSFPKLRKKSMEQVFDESEWIMECKRNWLNLREIKYGFIS